MERKKAEFINRKIKKQYVAVCKLQSILRKGIKMLFKIFRDWLKIQPM